MCSLFYLKAKNVEKLQTNLLNYFLRSKTMFAIFEQNNIFFSNYFWGFYSFFFHPSSVILKTILWVDGFPIVSGLGSCCLGVGLCQLLLPCSSISSSPHASIHILPHSSRPSLQNYTWCLLLLSLQLSLCLLDSLPPPLPRSAQPFHIFRRFRASWFSSQEMISKVGNAEINPGWDRTPEMQDCSLALYPLS